MKNSRIEKFDVTLVESRRLSQTTMDFRFVREDGLPVQFEPGQFYRFTFTDNEGNFERSYSLCNHRDNCANNELDLIISMVQGGRATKLLFSDPANLKASVHGPFGRLLIPEVLPKRIILVATSVGIAPYMPMLKPLSRLVDEGCLQVVLLFGVRDQSEFLYADAILSCVSESFQLAVCYSRETRRDSFLDYEHQGYVTDYLATLAVDAGKDHVLLCGNPQMVDDGYKFLRTQGFKTKHVVREKYVFAKPVNANKSTLSSDQKRLIAEKMNKYRKG